LALKRNPVLTRSVTGDGVIDHKPKTRENHQDRVDGVRVRADSLADVDEVHGALEVVQSSKNFLLTRLQMLCDPDEARVGFEHAHTSTTDAIQSGQRHPKR